MRFRNGTVGITADIEAMFHQVLVNRDDTDSLRFLWKDDMFSEAEPYSMQMLVHIFGARDSSTCAIYALKRTARDNYESFSSMAYETLLKAFYMDDLLKAVKDSKTAIALS